MVERVRGVGAWVGIACVAVALIGQFVAVGGRLRPLVVACLLTAGALMAVARWGGGLGGATGVDRLLDDDALLTVALDRELSRAARSGSATALIRVTPGNAGDVTGIGRMVRHLVRGHDVVLERPDSGDVSVVAVIEDEATSKILLDRLAIGIDRVSIQSCATTDRSENGEDLLARLEPYLIGGGR